MFPSMFGGDPFNVDPFEHMNRMMSQFQSPLFSSPFMMQRPGGMLQLEDSMRRHQLSMPVSPFEGMMGRMNGMQMMQNMQRSMMSLDSFPSMGPGRGGQSFQSSTIVMHNDGSGPRVIESTSSTRVGADGVKETRKSHKDSGTGEMRMAIGHHINDRAHIIEKAKNRRTGDEEEKQEYVNIEEEEAESFSNEWKEKMGASSRHSDARHAVAYRHPGMSRHEPYNRHHSHHHHRSQRGHAPQRQAAIMYKPPQDGNDELRDYRERPSSSQQSRR